MAKEVKQDAEKFDYKFVGRNHTIGFGTSARKLKFGEVVQLTAKQAAAAAGKFRRVGDGADASNAAQIVAEGNAEASALIANAQAEAKHRVDLAKAEAARLLKDADAEVASIEQAAQQALDKKLADAAKNA